MNRLFKIELFLMRHYWIALEKRICKSLNFEVQTFVYDHRIDLWLPKLSLFRSFSLLEIRNNVDMIIKQGKRKCLFLL